MQKKTLIQSLYTASSRVSAPLLTLSGLVKHHCLLCHNTSQGRICEFCEQQFLTIPTHCCHCCGLPLEYEVSHCGECIKNKPAFDNTVIPYLYQAPLSTMIRHFKENHHFIAGKTLSQLFVTYIENYYQYRPLPQLLVPVPLHWKKQWRRGFNQAIFFSVHLSDRLNIPILKKAKRIKYSNDQKYLNKKQRQKNLSHYFSLNTTLTTPHVAIIDDVVTTGSTTNALAKVLKQSGAKKVTVWALARTPKEMQ
ncbi:hypothetical protein AB835_08420 [Candidatus Endobugula sertula]|uniref:Double zinc ribbon domain-containing protein n=1 Tax=Candidatus Endobugula sertula TaxID=62101 RepID=A0A1D2QPS0_9GAMM|nr:hypothetical protein AB835_08420 [Candidatus Endobugula sertula]